MEILQILLNNLFGDGANELIKLLEVLFSNGFDIPKTLSALDANTILPLLERVFSAFSQTKSPTPSVGQCSGVNPIIKFADKGIVYTLNRYLCD